MNIIKIAVKSILGKKMQTILTYLIILTIFTAELSGLLLLSAVSESRNDTLRQIGVRIAISPKSNQGQITDQIIDSFMLENLMDKKHIVGIYSFTDCISKPLNFENVKEFTGINPSTQNENADSSGWGPIEDAKEYVWLTGDIDVSNNERFYRNQHYLIQGDFPDAQNPGAIISIHLANKNNLKIGDMISLQGLADSGPIGEIDSIIVGIYNTNLYFEIGEGNSYGEAVWPYSPYNDIFVDYDTASKLTQSQIRRLSVWVDSPLHLNDVIDQIEKDATWDNFDVSDITSYKYNEYAWQLESANSMAQNIFYATLILGSLILFIILTFWGDSYTYDTALYILLGYGKCKIFLLQFIQVLFITLSAAITSLIVSVFEAHILNKLITIDFASIHSDSMVQSFITGDTDIIQNFFVSLRPDVIAGLSVVWLIINIVAILLPLIITVNLKPRDVVSTNKRG